LFAKHQPLIAAHAKSPQGFADVVTFAIATQNQHFYRVGAMLDTLWTEGLDKVKALTGNQKRGIVYAHTHTQRYVDIVHNRQLTPIEVFKALLEIPNIGIVKAGFILQLVLGTFGCLDRHNLKTAGLDSKAFSRTPANTEALTQKLQVYAATCYAIGTSAQLYNSWCRLIALKYPKHFADAYEVSRLHAVWCRALQPVREHK